MNSTILIQCTTYYLDHIGMLCKKDKFKLKNKILKLQIKKYCDNLIATIYSLSDKELDKYIQNNFDEHIENYFGDEKSFMIECLEDEEYFEDYCEDADENKKMHAMVIFYKTWQYLQNIVLQEDV